MAKLGRLAGLVSFGVGVGIAIAYWLRQQEEAYQQHMREVQQRQAPPPAQPVAPQETPIILPQKALDEADAGDDLTRINGIGPKTAEAMRAIGISSFAALAKASAEEVFEKLKGLRGLTQEKVAAWIEQAAGLTA